MLVLLLSNLIVLPVAISFFYDDLNTRWVVFNSLSDVVFLTDLLINFRTGMQSGRVTANHVQLGHVWVWSWIMYFCGGVNMVLFVEKGSTWSRIVRLIIEIN